MRCLTESQIKERDKVCKMINDIRKRHFWNEEKAYISSLTREYKKEYQVAKVAIDNFVNVHAGPFEGSREVCECLCDIGRMHFELANYHEAVRCFEFSIEGSRHDKANEAADVRSYLARARSGYVSAVDRCVKDLHHYNDALCFRTFSGGPSVYSEEATRTRMIREYIGWLDSHYSLSKEMIDGFVDAYARRYGCGHQVSKHLLEIGRMYLNLGIHYRNDDYHNRAIHCFDMALNECRESKEDEAVAFKVHSHLAIAHTRKGNYIFAIWFYFKVVIYLINGCVQDPQGHGSLERRLSQFAPPGNVDEVLKLLPILNGEIHDMLAHARIEKLITDVKNLIEKLRFSREKIDLEKVDAAFKGIIRSESLKEALTAQAAKFLAAREKVTPQEINKVIESIKAFLVELNDQLKVAAPATVTSTVPATNRHRFLSSPATGVPVAATTAVAAMGLASAQ